MHLGVGDDHMIHSAVMTDKDTWDDEVVGDLLEQVDVDIEQVSADKAYDRPRVYDALEQHAPEADVAIPPTENLICSDDFHDKRRANIIEKAALGTLVWQKNHDYGKRNYSELAMLRYKKTFGNQLHARNLDNQKKEVMVACGVMNRFTGLGMPDSFRTH